MLKLVLVFAISVGIGSVVAYVKKHFHYTLEKKYLLSLIQMLLIVICAAEVIHSLNPDMNMSSLLLNSSALIVAILGFAAQPVIMNIICGLLISFQKPFDIGDRIIVEGQQAGIVEDITLRHTVIRIYDGLKVIIPNGELNSKTVTNFSYNLKDRRGIHLRFAVSYDSDVEKAMEIIRNCVVESPYTLKIVTDGMTEDSGPVYFMSMEDSSLILGTTIWISRETNSHIATSDINLRVLKAFREHDVEIPYPYFNVVEFEGHKASAEAAKPAEAYMKSATRHRRSETVHIPPEKNMVEETIQAARHYAKIQNMDARSAMQLELLTEEATDMFQRIMNNTHRDFWIEGTGKVYKIHIRASVHLGSADEYNKLVELSSSKRNEAAYNINRRILEAVLLGRQKLISKKRNSKESFEWKLSESEITEAEIGKSILAKIANDVRIFVEQDWVELIVIKTTE